MQNPEKSRLSGAWDFRWVKVPDITTEDTESHGGEVDKNWNGGTFLRNATTAPVTTDWEEE